MSISSAQLVQENRDLKIRVEEASERLKAELQWNGLKTKPRVACVLGSGLGAFAEKLKNRVVIPYKKIPHMREPAVPGHSGQWVLGTTEMGHVVLAAQGRVHKYEGYDFHTITLPIRMMHAMGIEHVVLTNAAGSVNPDYRKGDFMILDDHLYLMGESPLRGIFDSYFGQRFVDLSEPYGLKINHALLQRCKHMRPDLGVRVGVYAALNGPHYETRAEIRMLHKLGADAVGMSTAHEAIVARQCGMKINALSCITNLGCGLSSEKIDHEHVAEASKNFGTDFCWLVEELVHIIETTRD